MAEEKVEVSTISEDELNDILALGGPENVMTPADKTAETFFKNPVKQLEKLTDEALTKKPIKEGEEVKPTTTETREEDLDILDVNKTPEELLEKEENKGGRKKYEKSLAIETIKELIDEGTLAAFDDEKPLDEYTKQDIVELLKANFAEKERVYKEQTPVEFFEALPVELKVAAKYVADGGTDMKALFSTLARVEQTKGLDVTEDTDQETIVRNWLRVTNYGTDEEIEDEILSFKDKGDLEKKATQFKPKLIAKNAEFVAQELKKTEMLKKQQEEAATNYINSVENILQPDNLNGIPLDKKTKQMLFDGMVNTKYQSASGRNTNLLGHLLEKYNYIEPNHALIAEVVWHLADPEGFKAKLQENVKKEVITENVKKLKMAENNKGNAAVIQKHEDNNTRVNKIKRPNNLFKRPQ